MQESKYVIDPITNENVMFEWEVLQNVQLA
jgi:hypothetical protein